MSLITGCPACGTMFKVVADQLKISDGWVRCGHCSQVFDATANMVPSPPVVSEEVHPPPAAQPAHEAYFQPFTEPEPEAEAEQEPVPQASTAPSELPQDAAEPERESDAAPISLPVFGPSQLEQARRDAAEADAQLQQVSFVRDARRRAFWARPVVRAFLLLLVLALAALLALQYAVQERDRLAASEPALKPRLEQLCAWLHCSVAPPRQIDAVAIDSSSFNKLRGDTYRLAFTLKNSAAMPIAAPSMELTLTDTQEQPVLRRVLSPADLGAASPVMPANGEWNASVALAVGAAGNGRIAGYRLLAFYP